MFFVMQNYGLLLNNINESEYNSRNRKVKAFELKVYNEIKKSKVKNLSPSFHAGHKPAVKAQPATE